MSENQCLRCGRPTPDGYVCTAETARAAGQLAEIADMTPAARDIATGQASHSHGGGTGKPGSRLPFDLGATQRLDAVQNELTTWARHVVEERGSIPSRTADDDLLNAAWYLAENLEWFRHRPGPEVDEFLTDVEACARVVRGLARGPAAQRFLGPCGATRWVSDPVDDEFGTEYECDGDVYVRNGADKGTCKTCGHQVDRAAREKWLDEVRREWLYHASEIADAYPIKVMTIRAWLSRGLLVTHGEHDGRPLLKLGEVLDLAAGEAARREEARAKRARRMEQRSGEEAA